jgi:hypothetical protein
MPREVLVNINDLLNTQVADYVPGTYWAQWGYTRNRPLFNSYTIREMLIDPRVRFGLWIIKGHLMAKAKFKVESDTPEVQEFVQDQFKRFWKQGVTQALKAIEWGYSGAEVQYEQDEKTGRVVYAKLNDFEPPSVKIVTNKGERVGLLVSNYQTINMAPGKAIYLGGPKAFHHVHWKEYNRHYGLSRLYAAHVPWNEIWSEGGYRDVRRLWFYKNAFEGGIMRHPQGTVKLPSGQVRSYQDIAQEMIEKKRAGAVLTLPSDTDQRGNPRWDYEPAKGNTIPAGLFEYGQSLRVEILEALGIPPEVIESSGSQGFGSSSGRSIPEDAFYSVLFELLLNLTNDVVEQIVRPLVQINAQLGLLTYDTFDVMPFPLNSMPGNGMTDGELFPTDQQLNPMAAMGQQPGQPGQPGTPPAEGDEDEVPADEATTDLGLVA